MILVERTYRKKWPGIAAAVFQIALLAILIPIANGAEGPLRAVQSVFSQIAGTSNGATKGFTLSVDTFGDIEYRGNKITLGQVAGILDRDLPSQGQTIVGINVYETTDAATVAQIVREAEKAGVREIRLSVAKLRQ